MPRKNEDGDASRPTAGAKAEPAPFFPRARAFMDRISPGADDEGDSPATLKLRSRLAKMARRADLAEHENEILERALSLVRLDAKSRIGGGKTISRKKAKPAVSGAEI